MTRAPTVAGRGAAPNYGFVIDNRRCIGCHACTVACKAEHGDPIGVNKTWVSYIEKGVFPDVGRAFHVMRCNHCADAPCVEICPTACLVTRGDGIVDFDPGRCIGCKACMQACPYDAITIHPDSGTATKCNYCSHRVDSGREPACVVVCPTEAIVAGDLDDPGSRIARLVARDDVAVRKPEKGTRPKLFYIEGDVAALRPSAARIEPMTLWGMKPGWNGGAVRNGAAPRGAARRAYDIPQRHASSWGWKVSAYLFTKSIAAGAFLVPALFLELSEPASALRPLFEYGVPIALGALAVTGLLLVLDLERPFRFHWVLLRPQWRSWLVRGAYIITVYGALLLYWWRAGVSHASDLGTALAAAGGLLAAGTAAYSGWLFGQAKGRDLWQSPLAPLHLLVQSFVAGAATFLLLAPWVALDGVSPLLRVALIASALLVCLDVWGRHGTEDAAAAAHRMRSGARGWLLDFGVLLVGHVVPFFLARSADPVELCLSGALALAGLLIYEHLWVSTPQMLPLA